MEQVFEETYHELEREHWWFKARRHRVLQLLKESPRDARILDIGSSSGLLLEELRDAGFDPGRLYGLDISRNAIANCRAAGFANTFVADAQEPGLPAESFDVLIASDCLEHLADDRRALRHWHKLLKGTGTLIVFVPAYRFLWSDHDDVNQHYRRYTRSELRAELEDAGFQVVRSGYWNVFLFLPILVYRWASRLANLNRRSSSSPEEGDLTMPSKLINDTLTGMLYVENRLSTRVRFPFGVSTFCIAKR